MNNQGAHLAENPFGNVARALRCHADGKAIFPTFLGYHIECIEPVCSILVAEAPVQKLMRFIEKYEQRCLVEVSSARPANEVAPKWPAPGS